MVALLELGGRRVAGGAVQSAVVPPGGPFGGGQFHLVDGPPGSSGANELGLVEPHHRLRQGVVVAVAAGPHRGDRARSARSEVATRQPTMRRLKTSMIKAA